MLRLKKTEVGGGAVQKSSKSFSEKYKSKQAADSQPPSMH